MASRKSLALGRLGSEKRIKGSMSAWTLYQDLV